MIRSGRDVRGGIEVEGNRWLQAPMVVLALVSAGLLVWQSAWPEPIRLFGLTVDRLSAPLSFLVAGMGAVVFRFSVRYLDGNPEQPRFLRLLAGTVASAYLLMLSTNLLMLFAAWSLTSLGLHGLLTFERDRPEAHPPARKKFLISRLGDVALLVAFVLIARGWGTLDLPEFLARAAEGDASGTTTPIALLIAVAALTKSAQFPFHSWLPETMEAPTPVSALMHAGVINAGGALVIRFAPLLVRVPESLFLLVLVGSLTLTVGLLSTWAQVKVKRTLAWSTVSQMGFMMVQCGLGAFPLATLHILGHGCYKAWSFLRSGGLPAPGRTQPPPAPRRALALAAAGTMLAVPAMALAARVTGFSPMESPGELALAAILGLSIGQSWVFLIGPGGADQRRRAFDLALAVGLCFLLPVLAFALYRGVGAYLDPVLGQLPRSHGGLEWVGAAIPVGVLAGLVAFHACLPTLGRTERGRAFYVHALHGFYLGAVADRLVSGIWSLRRTGTMEVHNA